MTTLVKFEDVKDLWDSPARTWRDPNYVHIGRGKRGTTLRRSPWGNPYPIKQVKADYGLDDEQARLKSIELYREWIQTQPELLARLPELRRKTLVCHCTPEPCHGDVLLNLLAQPE
jgi:Domain of unknown function (DUF4326)